MSNHFALRWRVLNGCTIASIVGIGFACSANSNNVDECESDSAIQITEFASELEPFEFRTTSGLAWIDANTIGVIDLDDQQVVLIDPGSGTERRFGKKGSGPGELSTASSLFGDDMGGVIVVQFGNLSHFDAAGTFKSSTPIPGITLSAALVDQKVLAASTTGLSAPGISLIDLENGNTEALFVPVEVDPELEGSSASPVASMMMPTTITPAGLVLAGQPASYRISVFEYNGEKQMVLGRPDLEPEPRSPEEMDELMSMALKGSQASAGTLTRDQISKVTEQMRGLISPNKPAFSFIRGDQVGRTWVVTERGSGDSTVIDLFSNDGQYAQTLSLPNRVVNLAFNGQLVAALVKRTDPEYEGYSAVEFYEVANSPGCQ